MAVTPEEIVGWLLEHPGALLVTWLALCLGFLALLLSGLREADQRNKGQKPPEPTPKPERVFKEYTAEEVARHKLVDDCWIILDGKVYDVSSYVEEHPGGAAILRNAGADSTRGFHGPQHPDRVFDIIDDFCIGRLVPS
eukprot:jgi/Botrbrau1/18580/Bobra.0367s0023.1